MYKYVIFNNGIQYEKYSMLAAAKSGAITSNFQALPYKKIHDIINSFHLNKYIEIPLKKLWYKYYFDEKNICYDDIPCFIFWESLNITYSKSYLKYLKRKYIGSKFVFIFSNPLNDYNKLKYEYIKEFFDICLVAQPDDMCFENSFYYDQGFMYFPNLPKDENLNSDLFFIGSNKGRLSLLLEIYEKLSNEGVNCKFFITDVEKNEQKFPQEIIYNQYLDYDEVLKYVRNTKCVLEILQSNYNYPSCRMLEAVAYNKKLLTTNRSIFNHDLYNPESMRYFNTVRDIDVNFIRNVKWIKNKELPTFIDFANFLDRKLDEIRTMKSL